MILLTLTLYVGALLIRPALPLQPGRESVIEQKFSSVLSAMFTLFQVMTLDDWGEIYMELVDLGYRNTWIFFVAFIFFTNLLLLNLMTGVVVENVLEVSRQDEDEQRERAEAEKERVLLRLKQFFDTADVDTDGHMTEKEYLDCLENPVMAQLM